jgi:hypothetical protein
MKIVQGQLVCPLLSLLAELGFFFWPCTWRIPSVVEATLFSSAHDVEWKFGGST